MNIRTTATLGLLAAIVQAAVGTAGAGETIDVVVGSGAPELQRLAARELTGQLERLFGAATTIRTSLPEKSPHLVVVGRPDSNPAIREILGDRWPTVSDQGIVIRSFQRGEQQGIVVGGGSSAATLWAVYELGHRFGIRYLLREDIYPITPIPLQLEGFEIVMEPNLRTRTWQTINDFAIGPESWGLEDHRRFLKQLAKLKFNRIMLSLYPWHPFVHYEVKGVRKQTALLWFGERYRVDGDTPGRRAFQGARYFENPEFAGKQTYQERIAAGVSLAQGIIDEAHLLGMSAGISISPLEFPREFSAILPRAKPARGPNNLLIAPGIDQPPDDPVLKQLVSAKIRAYLETYPDIDLLYLTLPEFPEWDEHAEMAWRKLNSGGDLGNLDLKQMIASARARNLIASGERGIRSVKGNVVALAFLKDLFQDGTLLRRPDGRKVKLVITALDPALYPVLDRVVPEGAAALHFVDYTARRVVENREVLARVPTEKVPSSLILTLADDNVGILAQSATRRLQTLVEEIRKRGWEGFSTRYWLLAELDPSVYYLSRAAYDPKVTARSSHQDLFATITEREAAADRLWLGFGHIEKATELIDHNDLGFAFPFRGLLMKHYRTDPLPSWWKEASDHYNKWQIEIYRSYVTTHPRARGLIFYYAKRSECMVHYFSAVEAVRKAAIAQEKGDSEEALAQLEKAVEAVHEAMDAVGFVARDQSDRGLIAVLNAYAYRPLVAEYERLLEASE